MYHLKDGYQEAPGPAYFLDDATATRGIVFQPDVYTLAEYLAHLSADWKIVDVGCGWGDKLAAMHERQEAFEYYGIDFGPNLAHCIAEYSWGEWIEADLEQAEPFDVAENAIVICSDVIEHLADPTALLRALRNTPFTALVLSTPERDLCNGPDHMGPPPNLNHVREWNSTELRALLEEHGFAIPFLGLTRGNDQGSAMATQIAVLA